MWQFYSKKELLIKLFTVGSQLCKKVHNTHIGIHRRKTAKGGYLWIIKYCFYTFLYFFEFSYDEYVLFYNSESTGYYNFPLMYWQLKCTWVLWRCRNNITVLRCLWLFLEYMFLVINLHSQFVVYLLPHFNEGVISWLKHYLFYNLNKYWLWHLGSSIS